MCERGGEKDNDGFRRGEESLEIIEAIPGHYIRKWGMFYVSNSFSPSHSSASSSSTPIVPNVVYTHKLDIRPTIIIIYS